MSSLLSLGAAAQGPGEARFSNDDDTEELTAAIHGSARFLEHRRTAMNLPTNSLGDLTKFYRGGHIHRLIQEFKQADEITKLATIDDLINRVKEKAAQAGVAGGSGSSNQQAPPPASALLLILHAPFYTSIPKAKDAKVDVTKDLIAQHQAMDILLATVADDGSAVTFTRITTVPQEADKPPLKPCLTKESYTLPTTELRTCTFGILDESKESTRATAAALRAQLAAKKAPTPSTAQPSGQTERAGVDSSSQVVELIGSLVAEMRKQNAQKEAAAIVAQPEPGPAATFAVSEDKLKGKEALTRIARLCPALATALLESKSLDKAGWASKVKSIFQLAGVTISFKHAEAIGTLALSTGLDDILLEVRRSKYSGSIVSSLTLDNKLETLAWIVSTLCGAETPFATHVQRSCANIKEMVTSADPISAGVHEQRALPLLLDTMAAFVLDSSYAPARLCADIAAGWFGPTCSLKAQLTQVAQASLAKRILDVEQKTASQSSKGLGGGAHNGRANKDKKDGKRQRDDSKRFPGKLTNVCGHVLRTGKEERCKYSSCTRDHKWPDGTTDAEKAEGKQRMQEVDAKWGRDTKKARPSSKDE